MATSTFGTSATTSLTGLKFLPGYGSGMAAADIASINNAIKFPNAAGQVGGGGSFSASGRLFLPAAKGVIRLDPGDWVAVDAATGWPIVVSAQAIASGPWTHNP